MSTLGLSEKEILKLLSKQIRERGPILAARISSARAKGNAKRYCYWGVVRYKIVVGSRGLPVAIAEERAKSQRRSLRLARQDLDLLCKSEGRVESHTIGTLTGKEALLLIKDKEKAQKLIFASAVLCPDDAFAKEATKEFNAGKEQTQKVMM